MAAALAFSACAAPTAPAKPAAPTEDAEDPGARRGPAAFLELDGGYAVIRDGALAVSTITADRVVPGRAGEVWLFDEGRVQHWGAGRPRPVGTVFQRLEYLHPSPDGAVVMVHSDFDIVRPGEAQALWRVAATGDRERWPLPPGITRVKDGRVTAGRRLVLTENVLLHDDGRGFERVALPERSGVPERALAVAEDGTILVATASAVWRFDPAPDATRRFSLRLDEGAELYEAASGVVHAKAPLSVHRFVDGAMETVAGLGPRPEYVGFGPDGTVAAQIDGGTAIAVVGPEGEGRRIPATGRLAFGLALEDLVVGGAGQIWAVSPHGLVVSDPDLGVRYLPRNAFPALDADVRAITVGGRVVLPEVSDDPPTIAIEGHIRRGGAPVARTRVQACPVALSLAFHDGPPCASAERRFLRREVTSDAEGRFRFPRLPPGAWQLAYAYEGGWRVRLRRVCGGTRPGETCVAGDIGAR
ncbi:MAG: carboxypeptidase-like regulatory domain-containing protein [Myxococcota bacterium]